MGHKELQEQSNQMQHPHLKDAQLGADDWRMCLFPPSGPPPRVYSTGGPLTVKDAVPHTPKLALVGICGR